MDRRYELESLRRSIAMLRVGAPALDREAAMVLVREIQDLERQIRHLRDGMQRLLDESPQPSGWALHHLNRTILTKPFRKLFTETVKVREQSEPRDTVTEE